LRDKEFCAAVTFQTIEKFLVEGHIHFTFLIKKNCKESPDVQPFSNNDKKSSDQTKPKAQSNNSSSNKGILKGNVLRKSQSIPLDTSKPYQPAKKDEILMRQNSNPPDYSSINKVERERHFKSPAYCTSAINKNDDESVSTFFIC
jgi:uncharacterized membrane protein